MIKETLIRFYGETSQPLIVQNDMTGLTVPVPPKTCQNRSRHAVAAT